MNRAHWLLIIATLFPWMITINSDRTNSTQHHQLIIIGSGPAGLTAAIYAGRAKLKPLVIEGDIPGGLLTTVPVIENWPGQEKVSGADLINNMINHAKAVGAQLLSDQVSQIVLDQKPFIVQTAGGLNLSADAIIIATGMCPRKIGCAGEKEYWGRGVCNCALCDAPLYNQKAVVVVGGGMMALQNVLWLSKHACKITIIDDRDALQGPKKMVQDVLQLPQVEVYHNCNVRRIFGDEDHVSGIEFTDNKTNQIKAVGAQGVFVSIGYEPCTNLIQGKLPINSDGKIVIDAVGHTAIPGVFAAGNAAAIAHSQIVICAASGSIAAIEAEKYIGHKPSKKTLLSCQRS